VALADELAKQQGRPTCKEPLTEYTPDLRTAAMGRVQGARPWLSHDDLVAAHSFLQIGSALLLGVRHSYFPQLAALFVESELRASDAVTDEDDEWGGTQFYGYEATVGPMRQRLQVLGFTAERALRELDSAIQELHEMPDPLAREYEAKVPQRDAVVLQLAAILEAGDDPFEHPEEPEIFVQLDPRVVLRLALDLISDDSVLVRLNLDDLGRWGFITRGAPIADDARRELADEVSRDASLVVLTEGSSDSQLLRDALLVTHPHLVGFLRFMDFGFGAQGGVGSLVRAVQAFAGAGIANRVVAIADNDTAGRDALRQLQQIQLPDNYRVRHYPDLPLLEQYPTIGPQSAEPVIMNINGLAGSLEMYLGHDLLTLDGELRPVQWTSYVDGMKAYQGSLSKQHKAQVQELHRAKVRQALADESARAGQDWSGVSAIVDTILNAFG
jgi:hypothetical protein